MHVMNSCFFFFFFQVEHWWFWFRLNRIFWVRVLERKSVNENWVNIISLDNLRIVGRKITFFIWITWRKQYDHSLVISSIIDSIFDFPSSPYFSFLFFLFFSFFAMTHSYPIMMSHGSDSQPLIRFTVISFVYFEDFQLLLKVASRFIPQEFLVQIQAEVLTYLRITV